MTSSAIHAIVQGRATAHTSPKARGKFGNCASALRSFSRRIWGLVTVFRRQVDYTVKCVFVVSKRARKIFPQRRRDLFVRILPVDLRKHKPRDRTFIT